MFYQAIRQAEERKKDGPDARLGLLFLSKRNSEAEDPAKVQVSRIARCLLRHYLHRIPNAGMSWILSQLSRAAAC